MLSDAGATAVAPSDGAVLWEHSWPGAAITQPARVGDRGFLLNTNSTAGAGVGTRRVDGDPRARRAGPPPNGGPRPG